MSKFPLIWWPPLHLVAECSNTVAATASCGLSLACIMREAAFSIHFLHTVCCLWNLFCKTQSPGTFHGGNATVNPVMHVHLSLFPPFPPERLSQHSKEKYCQRAQTEEPLVKEPVLFHLKELIKRPFFLVTVEEEMPRRQSGIMMLPWLYDIISQFTKSTTLLISLWLEWQRGNDRKNSSRIWPSLLPDADTKEEETQTCRKHSGNGKGKKGSTFIVLGWCRTN